MLHKSLQLVMCRLALNYLKFLNNVDAEFTAIVAVQDVGSAKDGENIAGYTTLPLMCSFSKTIPAQT